MVNILCYKSKTLSNGENPLMIRICKDGKKKYQSLNEIKNKYDPEELDSLYVLFELADSSTTIENIYSMYNRAKKENIETLVFELKNKQKIIGVPVFTLADKIHIKDNLDADNDSIGNVKILTENAEIFNIMSNEIEVLYPNYKNTEV